HIRNIEFIATGSALISPNRAIDNDAGFLGKVLHRLEHFRGHRVLRHHALNHSAAISEDWKQQFSALAQIVKPPANGDRLAIMLADFRNCGYGIHLKIISPPRTGERREDTCRFRRPSVYSAVSCYAGTRLPKISAIFSMGLIFSFSSISKSNKGLCGASLSYSSMDFQSIMPSPGQRCESFSLSLS